MSFLKVSGTKIVDEAGNEVVLRGAGLGGWMKCVSSRLSLIYCIDGSKAWKTLSLVIQAANFKSELHSLNRSAVRRLNSSLIK